MIIDERYKRYEYVYLKGKGAQMESIEKSRKELRITTRKFAEMCGIDQVRYSHIRQGKKIATTDELDTMKQVLSSLGLKEEV